VLIQQSMELGSSITDALRIYSEDMRHKRLSRAEEKAYGLPSSSHFPMMLCIFPVLFHSDSVARRRSVRHQYLLVNVVEDFQARTVILPRPVWRRPYPRYGSRGQ